MIRGAINILSQVLTREITVKQAYFAMQMRLFNKQKDLNDDFDWTRYHLHYREELKSVSRTATLLPHPGDFEFSQGKLRKTNETIKPLHPNHHVLYEIILNLNPRSVLEVGCGGGDHLSNLRLFNPQIELFGIDRSEGQMATLRERHPHLPAHLQIMDVTSSETVLPIVDVVYSQAVLMHISETNGRFDNALKNILRAAQCQVVMVEHWIEHDFLAHIREVVKSNSAWDRAKYYFACHPQFARQRGLIISKVPLPFEELRDYEVLLQGQKLRIH
jgi:SAM-dependent methyltransferase